MKKKKTLLEKIKIDFRKIILGDIILNTLFLLFGIIIYINPYLTTSLVGAIIGIYFLIFGLFAIYEFLMRKRAPIFKNKIVLGVIEFILGLFIMLNPFKLIKILTVGLGVYLIFIALIKILEALNLKKFGYDGWNVILGTGIILLIFGIFITINPMSAIDIVEVTGIFIILSSILAIANSYMVYNKGKEIAKLFK